MKAVHIVGCVGVPGCYGGWETLAEYLVRYAPPSINYLVYCSAPSYSSRPAVWCEADLVYLPLSANGISSIFYDFLGMWKSRKSADVQLILGVSGCIFLPIIKAFSKSKLVVAIDGVEWERKKWGFLARRFLKLSEIFAVHFADEIITDNIHMESYVKHVYNAESRYIAYGADHVSAVPVNQAALTEYDFLSSEYAITVARIEPENNIHLILEAFSHAANLRLVVVGNWNNSLYGKKLRQKYEHNQFVTILDPIYDLRTINMLRSNAKLFVHGHSAGGTNPSLIEAMQLGLPVLAYDVSFNRSVTDNKAVYFSTEQDLIGLISDLHGYGVFDSGPILKFVASHKYQWQDITDQYCDLFNSL